MILTPTTAFFIAGDSLSLDIYFGDYPSDIWGLQYVLSAPAPVIVNGTPVADSQGRPAFNIPITKDISITVPPGSYATAFVLTKGDARATLVGTRMLVLPDPLSALPVSWAQTTLTQVQAALTKLSVSPVASATVNGESFVATDFEKLLRWRDRLLVEVASELAAMGRPSPIVPRRHRVVFRA